VVSDETWVNADPYLDTLAPATADHPYLRSKAIGRHDVGIGVSRGPLNILAGEDKRQLWGHASALRLAGFLVGFGGFEPRRFGLRQGLR
jgi:hypothetical protein